MLLGQTGGFGVRNCVDWGLGGIGGRKDDQRRQKQGCWLMRTDMTELKDEICF